MAKPPFPLFKPELVAEIAEQASKFLPDDKYREELHKSIQVVVQNVLARMEIVSREEFDAQTAVLEKTRAKVDALEKQLAEITEKLDQTD